MALRGSRPDGGASVAFIYICVESLYLVVH